MIASPPRSTLARRGLRPALLFVLVASLASAGCESARRPVPKNPIARDQARREGRSIVERACVVAGGLEHWRSIKDVTFRLDDRWSGLPSQDRKSTRLNSSHLGISYAVFCLKKKKKKQTHLRTTKHKHHNTNNPTI